PCQRAGIVGRVECGMLTVLENRAAPQGRRLTLNVVIARAPVGAAQGAVFFFTGGPGSGAAGSAGFLSGQMADVRRTRDLVFLDHRGTGRSHPLACAPRTDPAALFTPMFGAAETARCRQRLEGSADLARYTTTDGARDTEDLRAALGYERIDLHGSSYGTRSAWAYASRYPARTRAMVLHGLAPPGFHVPMPFGRGLDVALDGVIADCAADRACAARFPALRRDVANAFDRLRLRPARVKVAFGDGEVEASLSHGEFSEAVRYQLYTVAGAAALPSMLSRAAAGDYAALAQRSVENARGLERQISRGMMLSVTCAEDAPFMSAAAVRAAAAGTRLGDYRMRQQIAACREWPRGEPLGEDFGRTLQTPALVQAGQFDPATPLEWARRAMRLLPNGRLLTVPHGAHDFSGLGVDDCIRRVTNAFLTRGHARRLDTGCVAAATRPPFDLR
ncbi:MAG: alpha/beta hydrolase, partial [Acidobacteriota bacterium]|nr:alpha/beta hydrolase [Acidobacteriota bacterium]